MSEVCWVLPCGAWRYLPTLLLLAVTAHAQDSLSLPVHEIEREAPVDFDAEILPILKSNCLACHSASEAEGDLVLESPESIAAGGLSGAAIVAGNSSESLLFQAAAHMGDVVMPPEGNAAGAKNLSPEELGLLKLWIDQGAQAGERPVEATLQWRALPADLDPIYAVAITPHGRYAAAGWGNRLRVYQVATQRLVAELVDPSLTSSLPDLLVSTTDPRPAAHLDLVQSLDFSPDGERLASGGFRVVKIWRKVPPSVEQRERATMAAGTAPEPAGEPSLMVHGNLVQIEDGANGEIVRSLDLGRPVASAAIAPDRTRVVALGDGGPATVWDIATGEVVANLPGSAALRERIADAELEHRIRERQREAAQRDLDAANKRKEEAEERLAQAKSEVEAAESALAEKKKAEQEKSTAGDAAETEKTKAERETAERDLAAAQDAVALNEPLGAKAAAEVQAAEAALADAQGRVSTAAAERDRLQKELDAREAALVAVAFSPDGKEIAVVEAGGILQTFAATDGSPLESIHSEIERPVAIRYVDARRVEILGADVVGEVDTLPKWELERTIGSWDEPQLLADRVTALEFSPDGKLLAAGSGEPSRSGQINIFNVESGSLAQSVEEPHSDAVLSLAFSPDGGRLASGGADRFAKIFAAADGSLERVLEGHTGHVAAVAWHVDGRTLATASSDGTIKLWDSSSGEQQRTEGLGTPLTDVAFLGTEDLFVVTGGKSLVASRKTDGSGGPSYGGATDFVHAVAATRDGRLVVAGGEDGTLRVWKQDGSAIATLRPE